MSVLNPLPSPALAEGPDALRERGLGLAREKRWGEAQACLEEAVRRRPDSAEMRNNLGVVLSEQGRRTEALACFDEALRLEPDYPHALQNRGNALRHLGRHEDAVASYEQALRLQPESADTCNNLGIALLDLKRPKEAGERFRQALRWQPDHPEAHNNLGVALAEEGRVAEATAIYRQVLRHRPRSAETHNNLGVALAAQKQFGEAIGCYDRALELRPDYAEAHSNRGNALRQEGRLPEAQAALEQALRLSPRYAEAHNNLAIVHVKQGDTRGALASYGEAVRLLPDYAEAHTNRALAWLQSGDFEQGWPEYEWRWRMKELVPRSLPAPRWEGGPLEGQTVLLWGEQGLGDTLQFCRYAALLRERGATVLLEAPAALVPLLRRLDGPQQVLPQGGPLPEFDCHCPLLSLPGALGTRLESVPARVPYLSAEPERLRQWGERLAALPGIKVGIAWQGSTRYQDDRFRSIPLRHFEALARVPGVRLVSLQKGHGREQLPGAAGWPVEDLGERLDESGGAFLDTAAVLAHLDLVVTSDTALAHLAGALGAPVWVALGRASDWRWLLEREDCPWYPTMRLFRQKQPGDWAELFGRIADAVRRQRPAAPPARGEGNKGGPSAAALQKQGGELCAQGRYGEAIGVLRQAAHLQPEWAPTHNNLGVALAHVGQLAEAVAAYQHALQLRPGYAAALHNLGEALQRQGKWADAARYYEEALRLAPEVAQTHNNLGLILAEQGRLPEAVARYRQALRLTPEFAQAHQNLGAALEKEGKRREALDHYERAQEQPGRGAADCLRLARERAGQGKLLESAACYRLAARLAPAEVEPRQRLGQALAELGEHKEALPWYEEALRLRPGDAELLHDLGNACRRLGRGEEAEAHYREALKTRPDAAAIHNHLGICLLDRGRLAEAEAAFRESFRRDPNHAQAYNNLGVVLEQQRKLDEAIGAYEESLRLQPDNPDTHRNRALAWLLRGNYEQGWREYEWRWKCSNSVRRPFRQPRWEGGPLEGRTILMHPEQGLGDTLQFCRYAALLRERGATVLLEAPAALVPLLRRLDGPQQVLPQGGPLPDFDCHCPLLSLPGALGTRLESVPGRVPYLSAEPERLRLWGERLAALPGIKVGIAWQGSTKYAGDGHRSIPLRHFEALARVPGVRLVSLQKGHGREQLDAAAGWAVEDLGERLDESGGAFLDTAAVLAHLDLVVTSDTALAHLAGALGARVWVALGRASDWRWLLEREDCPWYPTMRLFRQKQPGDWAELFGRIADAVRQRSATPALRQPLMVETSPGELLDKIGILEIKRRRIADPDKLCHVWIELGALQAARARALNEPQELAPLVQALRDANERLWVVEDDLREQERQGDFGAKFVELARSVYRLNDERGRIKRRINDLCGSALVEEKSYAPYDPPA